MVEFLCEEFLEIPYLHSCVELLNEIYNSFGDIKVVSD